MDIDAGVAELDGGDISNIRFDVKVMPKLPKSGASDLAFKLNDGNKGGCFFKKRNSLWY